MQTAKATKDISDQISGIQSATGDAVGAIRTIAETIGEIHEIATTIASSVEEQEAATREISRNAQEAAHGTQEVSSNVPGVQPAAGQPGAAAGQVLSPFEGLSRHAAAPRQESDRFRTPASAAQTGPRDRMAR